MNAPYREPGEKPIEPPEPSAFWAAATRLVIAITIALGPIASLALYVLGPIAIAFWLVHLVSLVAVPLSRATDDRGWWAELSWPKVLLLAAWAPIAMPVLAIWRISVWVRTGT